VTEFYFDTSGDWIAYSVDRRYVWSNDGDWVGWRAFGDADVITPSGKYLGTIVGNRLVHFDSHPFRGYPGYPGYPGHPGYPGYPGFAGYAGFIPGARDLEPADYDG
jgi:hypothetical protein